MKSSENKKKRGGWTNPASAANGAKPATGRGRPPKQRPITLSEIGPDGVAPSVTGTATIGRSLIKIALEDGRKLTIWID